MITFIIGLISIAVSTTDIPFYTILQILVVKILPNIWLETDSVPQYQEIIVWTIRIPRTLIAALVGAALALAGTQMQGLLQNSLASPDIIGTSAGGALGAVVALATGLASYSLFYVPLFAFSGAFIALLTVYSLATQHQRTSLPVLLLAGVAINAAINALISLIIAFSWTEQEVAREITFWMLGGLDGRTWLHVGLCLPGVIVGSLIAFIYSRELDILLLGQETAATLGVEVERVKQLILISIALLTGSAVAVSGVVGFVGLIIPHIVRFFVGPRHLFLLPASAIVGAAFLMLMDLLARTLNRPEEIYLGILTTAIGSPFFLFLLLHYRNNMR